MASITYRCMKRELLKGIPGWVQNAVQYETLAGSHAYSCENEDSDYDVYGIVMPPKSFLFPHIDGHIQGYDPAPADTKCFEFSHIPYSENREYDLHLYTIAHYFRLCADCNPNMVDSLFTKPSCELYISEVGQKIKAARHLFLSKKVFHTMKGYAYQQRAKVEAGRSKDNPRRKEWVEKYGYDVKFAYHVVRLVLECEQILETGDLDLTRDREIYKSIRRGEWKIEEIHNFYDKKLPDLDRLYSNSTKVPHDVQWKPIKTLLLNCLEHHYGSLSNVVSIADRDRETLLGIKALLETAGI